MSNQAQRTVFCRDCGEEIDNRAEICPECGIRQKEAKTPSSGIDIDTDEKDSGLAAAASFIIPGLGQVYNGEIGKGIALGAVTVLLVASVFGAILGIPLWIWLVYDAYKTAEGKVEEPISTQGTASKTVESQQEESEDTTTESGTKQQNATTEESEDTTTESGTKQQNATTEESEDTTTESGAKQQNATTEESSMEIVPEGSKDTSSAVGTHQESDSSGIDWRTGIQIFIGLVVFLIGVGITIQSPVGVPIALVGLVIIPAAREWGAEKLGASTD